MVETKLNPNVLASRNFCIWCGSRWIYCESTGRSMFSLHFSDFDGLAVPPTAKTRSVSQVQKELRMLLAMWSQHRIFIFLLRA
jgi:hypothetical protein